MQREQVSEIQFIIHHQSSSFIQNIINHQSPPFINIHHHQHSSSLFIENHHHSYSIITTTHSHSSTQFWSLLHNRSIFIEPTSQFWTMFLSFSVKPDHLFRWNCPSITQLALRFSKNAGIKQKTTFNIYR